MNRLQLWLLSKYAPGFFYKTPYWEDFALYEVEVLMLSGYWGTRRTTMWRRKIRGAKKAYLRVRWAALCADWRFPNWLYACGIHYSMRRIENEQS